MKVGLYCDTNGPVRGPHKVAKNLISGLGEIGIDVALNKTEDLTGCLHSGPYLYSLPRTTLVGPNIVVTPDNDHRVWGCYTDFVVPSYWVYHLYQKYQGVLGPARLHVWSVGIDTKAFNDDSRAPTGDCLLYIKGKDPSRAIKMLTSRGISYTPMTYGSYQESELIEAAKRCKYCLLCTGTESQGIAYMEILSSGLPCFVMDETVWLGRFPATSVPYFSEGCGIVAKDPSKYEELFDSFINNISFYRPREYIIEYHTLEKSALRYIDLIKISHNI